MKRLHFADGGRPLSNNDLSILQEELYKAVEQQYSGLGSFIVSGCSVSGTTIASGLVFIDGKILPFSGASNVTFPTYIKQAAVQDQDVVAYETGGSHPKRKFYTAELVSSQPASGGYIVMSASGGRSYYDAISSEVVRMRGNQTVQGNKTFSGKITISDYISLGKMDFDGHFINALKTGGLDSSNDTLPTTKAVKEYIDAAYKYRGSGGDANSYIEDGVAQGRPFSANHPAGASHGAMFIAGSPSGTRQMFMDDGGNVFYRAQSWDGVWSTWKKSWHDGNFDPTTKADKTYTDNELGKKVNKELIWNNVTFDPDFAGTLQYAKDGMGFVHLKGLITTRPTTGIHIPFTLPVGFRPIGADVNVYITGLFAEVVNGVESTYTLPLVQLRIAGTGGDFDGNAYVDDRSFEFATTKRLKGVGCNVDFNGVSFYAG
jgi:hypothetical protein